MAGTYTGTLERRADGVLTASIPTQAIVAQAVAQTTITVSIAFKGEILPPGLPSLSAVARKSVILDGTSTTTCRGCISEHRRQEPVWTSVRGAGVKAVSPAERGRSEATRLDVGAHTRTLLA